MIGTDLQIDIDDSTLFGLSLKVIFICFNVIFQYYYHDHLYYSVCQVPDMPVYLFTSEWVGR